ncbi:MAG: hypothetical protein K6L73_06460 [Cellvibrionaceae bacterium]
MKLSVVLGLLAVLLTGCAKVTYQNRLIFKDTELLEDLIPEQACNDLYKQKNFNDIALYQPEDDLKAYIRLASPGSDNVISASPVIPLPILLNPVGIWQQSRAYSRDDKSHFDGLRLAVYPQPHIAGYSFEPEKVRLSLGGTVIEPQQVQFLKTHNLVLQDIQTVEGKQILQSHTGEYQVYILDFPLENYEEQALQLTIQGFSSEKGDIEAQAFALTNDFGKRFDWWYDTPVGCQ